jgi:transcriptional regulator with XRE-family HTH domain
MTTSNVVQLKRMSDTDYERERALLRETYGDNQKQAGAKRDQALAKLLYRSGWTQQELAKKEGCGQPTIGRRLKFGDFLSFVENMPVGINSENTPFTLPLDLTEGKFRKYWQRTDKTGGNDRERFLAVARLMRDELSLRHKNRPPIGKAIAEKFADAKWHQLAIIAKAVDADEEHVVDTLRTMQSLRGTHGCRCEQKKTVKGIFYRIYRFDRKVSADEIKTKLHPIIAGLKAEGKKSVVTMSVVTVAKLAVLLERMVDEWVEGDKSSKHTRPDELAATIAGVKDDNDD